MGAGVGAAAGATAGLVAVLLSRGPDAVLAKGTTLEMVLDRPLQFTPEEIARFRELLDRLEAERTGRKKKGGKP